MEFSEIVEYAKSGLELPKISSQSEHLAYLTVICILEAFRNRTINGAQAKNQKEKAEQLFHDAREQETDRLMVYQTYQQNILKVEEILHEINKEFSNQEADKDKIIDLSLRALEVLTNIKLNRSR
ncbi:MAG: hypothetical protein ACLRXW_08120 [Negativibacillus massiliensis]|uniref:hypothetical protein n=1 Tax=Negativibacillus massiliensis TaxID=1871035 RepID=UPI0039A3A513